MSREVCLEGYRANNLFFSRVVGTLCVAIPMVLNGAIGAKLHVPFSVITSTSYEGRCMDASEMCHPGQRDYHHLEMLG